jgi:hypothetical protein
MTKYAIVPALFILTGSALLLHAATDSRSLQADREAITQAALDYIDGFYEGSAERMERALHPDLAKRNIVTDRETGAQSVRNVTAKHLIEVTGSGMGKQIARRDGRRSDVTILDIYHDVATVKIMAITWIDYLHLAKVDGGWKIVNVLWAWSPTGASQ